MTKLLAIASFAFTLFSCTNNDKSSNNHPAKDTVPIVQNDVKAASGPESIYSQIGKDSVTILPFEIEVALSPRAQEKMTSLKETIIVSVFFTGTPKDSSEVHLAEDGSFYLTSTEKEIRYGEIAKFDSIELSREIYDQLTDKDIDLGINVFSGRQADRNNILNCDVLFDKISNVVNKRFTLKCKLIYGED